MSLCQQRKIKKMQEKYEIMLQKHSFKPGSQFPLYGNLLNTPTYNSCDNIKNDFKAR
jgi:hypothetical protein